MFPVILLVAVFGAGDTFAHSSEAPLFVAEDGVDGALCQDHRAPCRTIGYALSIAGKGAEIRIAAGSYAIEDAEDVFYIVSGTVQVVGGFDRQDGFQTPRRGSTTLIGVPFQYRQSLEARGFDVIADRKGIDGPKEAAAEKLLGTYKLQKSGAPASPCTSGMAGILPCDSIDLLAHFAFDDLSTVPQAASDVWGFVDLNTGREYAIVGYNIGIAVIDVTDPENPAEVGFVDGQNTTWRDIKIHQLFDAGENRWHAYAYVTADRPATDGLVVLDLGGLPHRIRKTGYGSDILSAHNLYAANTDYSTGLAIDGTEPSLAVAGSNIGSGEYRAYSLADPAVPERVGGATTADYMHDSSSLVIADARKDTQCENGGEFCEVLVDFNEDTVDVWDITRPENAVRLSSTQYSGSAYVHSGWPSEDGQVVFVHDEQDEQQGGLPTTVRVFSLADLRAPVQVGKWTGPTRAIDHNGFVRGNRYYIANYTRGLTVLDISDPTQPVTAGFLDTHPTSDSTMFMGAWGTFPFFFSNTVAISDIDTGLYLARDRTLDVTQGSLSFAASSFAADETQVAALAVRRSGGSAGNISVKYEILDATTDAADHQAAAGTLTWAAGDTTDKVISLSLANDGVAEGLERLFVRLIDPEGRATLGDIDVASVYLSDPGAAPGIGFFEDSIDIAERGFATAVVVLQRSGSALGSASVAFAMSGGSAVQGSDFEGSTSGTVSWPAGDGNPKNLTFDIIDDGASEPAETLELTLSNPAGAALDGSATMQVNILDRVNAAPNAIAGVAQTVAGGSQVTLDGGQSNDPDGDGLTFEWTQTSGAGVALSDADTSVARFTAPSVSSDSLLRFQLTVRDPSGLSDSGSTSVTVTATGSGSGGSGGGSIGVLMLVAWLTVWLVARRQSNG